MGMMHANWGVRARYLRPLRVNLLLVAVYSRSDTLSPSESFAVDAAKIIAFERY